MTDPVSYPEPLAHPETRGIEVIEASERHGRARDLFPVWAAPNVSVLNFTVGASLILLGMELWQAFVVIAAGSLPWILTGIVATSGPAAGGTSGSVITRASTESAATELWSPSLDGSSPQSSWP